MERGRGRMRRHRVPNPPPRPLQTRRNITYFIVIRARNVRRKASGGGCNNGNKHRGDGPARPDGDRLFYRHRRRRRPSRRDTRADPGATRNARARDTGGTEGSVSACYTQTDLTRQRPAGS